MQKKKKRKHIQRKPILKHHTHKQYKTYHIHGTAYAL